MARPNLNDLAAFLAVARERSFTRAAAQLGVSQSALSQVVNELEGRLGLRLPARTNRSVSPTEAGEQLLQSLGPHLDDIDAGLAALVLPDYPDIQVELVTDSGLTDIVAGRFDAGVRLGEIVAWDMVAVPIGPDMRRAAVGAPAYFARRRPPSTPGDLTAHSCINLRLPAYGGLYAWEFEEDGRELRVRIEGQVVFNTVSMILQAALNGFGIAYLPQGQVQPRLDRGELTWVLEDWSPPFPGYHLYCALRRQNSAAFEVVVEALRFRS